VGPVRALGLDLEQGGPLGEALVTTICRNDELGALAGSPPPGSDWPKLFFAMKEAAYKAWFPLRRRPLEFHGMRVTVDAAARSFRAEVLEEPDLPISGRFGWDDALVFAGAVIRER
jgi:4'-phosphopantetheinyl transferase EntD